MKMLAAAAGLALASLISPAKAQWIPGYNVKFPAGCVVSVVDFGGKPALLLVNTSPTGAGGLVAFDKPGKLGVTTVELSVVMGAALDQRPCAPQSVVWLHDDTLLSETWLQTPTTTTLDSAGWFLGSPNGVSIARYTMGGSLGSGGTTWFLDGSAANLAPPCGLGWRPQLSAILAYPVFK